MKQRLQIFCIMIAVLLPLVTPALSVARDGGAEAYLTRDSGSYYIFELMKNLGIFEEIDGLELEETVSRGEFAKYLVIMAGLKDFEAVESKAFTDVSKGNEYKVYIDAAVWMGYMNGYGDDKFGVSEQLSFTDAVTALVRVTGYQRYAESYGGYPVGYGVAAEYSGITKGVAPQESLKRKDAAQLCFNAMTAKLFTVTEVGEGVTMGKSKEDTLLSVHHGIFRDSGIVTANRDSKLYSVTDFVKKDEMEIDKTVFRVTQASYHDYIGQCVDFFYKENKQDIPVIVSMAAKKSANTILTLHAEEIQEVRDNKITYTKDEKKKNAKLTTAFAYLYNGRLKQIDTLEELEIEEGTLTLIDNDGDEIYDAVLAKEPKTYVVTGIDPIYSIIHYDGGKLEIDTNDSHLNCAIYEYRQESEKELMDIDELKKDDILTAYISADGRKVELYSSRTELTGTVDAMRDEYIVVDQTAYEAAETLDKTELSLGMDATFGMDMFGRLALVKESAEEYGYKYGFVFAAGKGDALGNLEMRLVTSNGEETVKCAQSILLDGIKKTGAELEQNQTLFPDGELERQLVRYKKNTAGRITALDTLAKGKNDKNDTLVRNVTGSKKYFPGLPSFEGQYRMGPDTFILTIPSLESEEGDITKYQLGYSFNKDEAYPVELYDLDETQTLGAVIIKPQGSVMQPATNEWTNVGIISKFVDTVNEDGEASATVHLMANGKMNYYNVDIDYVNPSDYVFGEVVKYVLDSSGTIVLLKKEFAPGASYEKTEAPAMSSEGYFTYLFGEVTGKFGGYAVVKPAQSPAPRLIPTSSGQCYVVNVSDNKRKQTIAACNEANIVKGAFLYSRVYSHDTTYLLVIYNFYEEDGE